MKGKVYTEGNFVDWNGFQVRRGTEGLKELI